VRLLVLGGTAFLGRAVVEEALAGGHDVTLFTRGRTSPDLFPEAERLRGDRDAGDLAALGGREWDAVVDTSGYVPRVVRESARLLAGSVGHYAFVSSISVYRPGMPAGYDETWPVVELDDPAVEEVRGDTYGGLKALCERAVEEELDGRCLHVRAGLIVGPHDPTGRFTYWARRLARGGDVLLPAPPGRPFQVVDVRDLAAWILRAAGARLAGAITATAPVRPFADLVEAGRAATGSDARGAWVDEELLLEQEVREFAELPLWISRGSEFAHFLEADVSRALAAGLTTRPLAETVRAALEQAEPVDGVGLAPERERELLRLRNVR
jgi:2'-hydroxyisoflavone reductase